MAEEKKLRVSYGYFEATGTINVTPDSFQTDLKGKNSPTYQYSRINLKMEDENGNTFYLNAMDGFDTVKGKTIYANIKDSTSNEQMQISFADRKNEEILKHIDNRSFVSVALQKVENEEGKKVWDYKNFLALYDAINFIKDRFETGMKIRVTGQTRYSTYNDSLNKDYQINNIYLLSDEDTYETGFTFRQDVILKEDSVDMSEWDEKLIAKIDAEVLTKSKGVYSLLKLPLVVRGKEEDKEKRKLVIEKYLTVSEGKVRRIKLEGKYKVGYEAGKLAEDELPEEALELIELGLYDKEEVMKMYVNRDRVDEMAIIRPVVQRRQGEKPRIDMSDEEYTLEDLDSLQIELPIEKEIKVESDSDDLSFLDELD
ncbi:hypothetical protein P4571_08495 [Niallia alba]|uniref:hypothetical protein n=1 Tax=Niallia alba TaxID=2729105 RepID=UPI002E24C35F|nr:hypothetical protein [Niallia alba]